MTRLPFYLVPLLGVAIVLLTGALNRPAPPVPAPVTDAGPLPEGRDARQLLDDAVATYQPARVPWQQAQLWQRVRTDGGTRELQGRYLMGPDSRLRLELGVQVGKTRAELLLVGDGQRLWQRQRVGSAEPVVTQAELPVMPKDHPAPAAFLAERTRGLHQMSFGVSTLLALIRDGGQGWQGKSGRWAGGAVLHLNASWPGAEDQAEFATEGLRAPPRAKRVCVFLDAATLWPQRVEWWGETADGDPVPVVEMEFRAPVLNQPLTPEECRREFTFVP
jgi:hypothetical protein